MNWTREDLTDAALDAIGWLRPGPRRVRAGGGYIIFVRLSEMGLVELRNRTVRRSVITYTVALTAAGERLA